MENRNIDDPSCVDDLKFFKVDFPSWVRILSRLLGSDVQGNSEEWECDFKIRKFKVAGGWKHKRHVFPFAYMFLHVCLYVSNNVGFICKRFFMFTQASFTVKANKSFVSYYI